MTLGKSTASPKPCPLCGREHHLERGLPLGEIDQRGFAEMMVSFMEHLRHDLQSTKARIREPARAFLTTQAFYDLMAGLGVDPDDARAALEKIIPSTERVEKAVYRKTTNTPRRYATEGRL